MGYLDCFRRITSWTVQGRALPGASVLNQPQAFEAIAHDTVSLMSLFLTIQHHPKAELWSLGVLPPASMYVVESHKALKKLAPDVAAPELEGFANRVRSSRHRAKLLDDTDKNVEQVTIDLAEVAKRQARFFMDPHTGVLGPLKRAIQPDLGLSTYDGHIFATTHATAFSFGHDYDLSGRAVSLGRALGAYTATMLKMFGLQMPMPAPPSALPGAIEMRDIKSQALYGRGPLGKTPTESAAGMTLLLVNLNHMRCIMQKLLPVGGLTQFRLKFIVAYHADSNLRDYSGPQKLDTKVGRNKVQYEP